MNVTHELKQLKIKYDMYISRVTIVSTKVPESSVERCKLVFLPRWQKVLNLGITSYQYFY